MARRREKSTQKFRRRVLSAKSGLVVTSMLDILTTILFFLLKNYSYVVTNFNVASDLQLPQSNNLDRPPASALQLVVTKKSILLDDVEIVPVINGDVPRAELHTDGVTIKRLHRALSAHRNRSKKMATHSDTHSFNGTVVLQADKGLQFRLLKKVVYTAGVTDFVNLKLAVLKKEITIE